MRSLEAVLGDLDLGHLRIVAELWGLELAAGNARDARAELAAEMLTPLAAEIAEALASPAHDALQRLKAASEGRMPYTAFVREFGEIREMGPARRDREQPWRAPASAAEALWYRGFVARAFADTPQGPQEFIFVPRDLREWLPEQHPPVPAEMIMGAPHGPVEKGFSTPASTAIVDDACTLLAHLQICPPKKDARGLDDVARAALSTFLLQPHALDLTLQLTIDLGLVVSPGLRPNAARAKPFLESPRTDQYLALTRAWRESQAWNDLFHVSGLRPEGAAWRNGPVTARAEVASLLKRVPGGEWWSLDSFVRAVKSAHPDFQRSGGEYESWYIRDASTGEYLRGFEHWDAVDGALIRYLIAGPLHWLGALDLARESPGGLAIAFRLSRFSAAVLDLEPVTVPEPVSRMRVQPDGRIRVPRAVGRYERFQVARFTEWVGREGDVYDYRLSPSSVGRAGRQGVRVPAVLAFLRKASETPVPPALERALTRTEANGPEARVELASVLKVASPAVLQQLRESPTTRRYLGEALGDRAVEVKRVDVDKLLAAAAELGLLIDVS